MKPGQKSLATFVVVLCLLGLTAAVSVGERVCIKAGLNLRNGPCGAVSFTSRGSESGKVLAIQRQACSFGTYTWVQVDLGSQKVWGASETGLILACSTNGGGRKDLNVTQYVNQRWDTPDSFGGSWACGPTSAVMAMAYFGKIKPHPITCSSPSRHVSDFGWYVSTTYTSPTGFVFNRQQSDSNGRPAWGAYGTCTDGGGAWAWRIQDYAKHHGLVADFYATATYALVIQTIDSGNLVVLSTQLTNAGHLILVRGYDNGNIIVNDPWGNKNVPGYTGSGYHVTYTWAQAKTKWCVVIRRPSFAAELENLPMPAPEDFVTYVGPYDPLVDE